MIYMNAMLTEFFKGKKGEKRDYDKIEDLKDIIKNSIYYKKNKGKIVIREELADGEIQITYPYSDGKSIQILSSNSETGKIQEEQLSFAFVEEMIIEAIMRVVILAEDWENITVSEFSDDFKQKISLYPIRLSDEALNYGLTNQDVESLCVTWIYDKIKPMIEQSDVWFDSSFFDTLSQALFLKYVGGNRIITHALNKSKFIDNIEKGLVYGLNQEKQNIKKFYGLDLEELQKKSIGR